MHGEQAFGPSFQRALVRTCLADPGLRALVARFVTKGQLGFTDPAAHWCWGHISAQDNPTILQLRTEANRLAGSPICGGVEAVLAGHADWRESDYVRNEIVQWARRQVFRAGFEDARDPFNRGDVDAAYTLMMRRMDELSAIRLEAQDRGWFFEELDARQERRAFVAQGEDYIPTGITRLDRAMNGGTHYGELEVTVAYSGIGKTFWCVHRGFIGARMRRRCLHFVLEGGRKKTEDRYEARWADTVYKEVRRGSLDERAMRALRSEYALLRHHLVLRGFADRDAWAVSYDDLLAELGELRRAHGWVPDLILVDYGDLMSAPGDSEYQKQKMAYRQLKALSERVEFPGHPGYVVISPSQAQRPAKGADEKEHVLVPQQIADCYEKVRVADAIITLNRTRQEQGDAEARVYLGKYRDDEDGTVVRVRTKYTHGAFCEIGMELPLSKEGDDDDE